MQRIWQRILDKSGVRQEGVSLHTLRHSAATLLLQSGTCDIVQIQKLLGHERLETTAMYLHVEQRDLQEAMSVHPLGGGRETKSPGEVVASGVVHEADHVSAPERAAVSAPLAQKTGVAVAAKTEGHVASGQPAYWAKIGKDEIGEKTGAFRRVAL
jgi:hypothetical protein